MIGYLIIYLLGLALDGLFAWSFGLWIPLFPSALASGYLLAVVTLSGLAFISLFQALCFSTKRNSVEIAWNGMMVLGPAIHLSLVPTPPIVSMIFLSMYLALMFLIRKTIIRSAVIRCYKAEFPERTRTFQAQVDREAKKLHPENAARYQGP